MPMREKVTTRHPRPPLSRCFVPFEIAECDRRRKARDRGRWIDSAAVRVVASNPWREHHAGEANNRAGAQGQACRQIGHDPGRRFVREEIREIRRGEHGAKSPEQAIAIGLSKARRAGVRLRPPAKGKAKASTRRSAKYAYEVGQGRRKPRRRPRVAAAISRVLKKELRSTVSRAALSRHAKRAAARRSGAQRVGAARKAARHLGSVLQ
jgi:hypothetical protein